MGYYSRNEALPMIKLNKAFKSAIDKFLENFDKQHPERSLSQREEEQKYAQISELGGFPVSKNKPNSNSNCKKI